MQLVARHEAWYKFPLLVALALIIAGSLPYAYGYLAAGPGERFMGFVGRAVPANNEYLMFAKQAQEGMWLFENRLTPEILPRAYFGPEWLAFGKFARWTGLSLIATFHVSRVLVVVSLVFALHYLLSLCLASVFQRRLALLLILLGSGFGWVLLVAHKLYSVIAPTLAAQGFHNLPWKELSIYLVRDVDGVLISSYLVNVPHFMLAGVFIVLTYAFLLSAEQQGGAFRLYVLSGLSAMIHLLIRPYAFPEICLVYMSFMGFMARREGRLTWRRVRNYAVMAALLVPAFLYYVHLAHTNALGISGWERKAGYFSQYIVWYGLPLLLLALYFRGIGHHRHMTPAQLLMTLWFSAAFFLAQLFPLFKAGEEAALFPFVIATAVLIMEPLRDLYGGLIKSRFGAGLVRKAGSPERLKRLLAVSFVVFCSLSSCVAYARMFTRLHTNPYFYYLSNDLHDTFMWLAAKTQPHDVVMASLETCPFVPRYAGNKVFTGQDMLTSNFDEKNNMMYRFLGARGDDEFKREVARKYGVRYLLMGPKEKQLNGIDPSDHRWLRQVFSTKSVSLYEVNLSSARLPRPARLPAPRAAL